MLSARVSGHLIFGVNEGGICCILKGTPRACERSEKYVESGRVMTDVLDGEPVKKNHAGYIIFDSIGKAAAVYAEVRLTSTPK